MNRSLEALAIFTICLGGILAAVRFSAQDHSAVEPSVASPVEQASPSAPPKNSGSAAEQGAPDDCELAYALGCGLDRHAGQIYAPCSPLLSPREVALRAIRSEPIPLVSLPEVEVESLTGYDATYDAAMNGEPLSPAELSRAQVEAEYAAAELAAADLQPIELTAPSPTWHLITGGFSRLGSQIVQEGTWLQQSYVVPVSRAVEQRWSTSVAPLLKYPRAKAEARQLLHRQRAAAESAHSITWDDYLAFAGRRLPVPTEEAPETRVARQKSPRNVLWPR